jgi:hypothetical protein
MARIRTIKPEFPQSESMGRVSRESRLLFILLWTLADDSGRLRGDSRMLASVLYPYDDDAKKLLPKWIAQLEKEKCVHVYVVEDSTYLQILNWSAHQKIDKPSKSKIPAFGESPRIVANPLEPSRMFVGGSKDQGSRIKGSEDQGAPRQIASAIGGKTILKNGSGEKPTEPGLRSRDDARPASEIALESLRARGIA